MSFPQSNDERPIKARGSYDLTDTQTNAGIVIHVKGNTLSILSIISFFIMLFICALVSVWSGVNLTFSHLLRVFSCIYFNC